ncbi:MULTISPECIES: ComF family protein [Chryseobacterium]|uniref:Competence protein ComFC n=1 Tax=Chryseobacterium camelliae TaxID=1265445 RepID=A0ABU0TK54_9FLAO|nr:MULTISPECIES: double zinc ribbon domain-containing protein [Chryseobacterium]MDT3408759.1 competence protein ComFC [Pseudacidovorax intermedius]MDQ1097386.1 competence protein ComFC [Chryseobacterium camelliae]MDQ1101317.1 competence protein ComFC [Chryseobacterium sp. SORGH_AS_1048]MDR6084762.1 competence protein ComFC [Chryseobacterium sp. SORGH_AS_0909]MDR6133036.1 competence protein ComFC [Chryseobacterium sp. SORGH_AS_1175]
MMLDLLFPNRCLECNRIIEADLLVCNLCFSQIHFTHFDYFGHNLLKERCRLLFPVEHAFALMQFEKENLSRKIVHELKYRNREKTGKIIAGWIPQHLDFKNKKPDLLVSVPLHPRKQRERGYNQLHTFTDALSKFYGIPADHSLIKRNHYSKAQALKDKQHRLQAENTFSLTRNITGQHILLIDDVFTTGNTLATIAWEILNRPGNTVSVLVMAMDE